MLFDKPDRAEIISVPTNCEIRHVIQIQEYRTRTKPLVLKNQKDAI